MPPEKKQSAARAAKANRGAKPTASKSQARARASANRAGYLNRMSTAVRGHFAEATDLPTFLEGAGQLTQEQRKLIVRQALVLIEQNYAHLPLKRAMHSVDPVQRLKLLLQALERDGPEDEMTEAEFHHEVTDIISSLRDLHTNYLLPAPFNQMTAFLPFMVEDYFENGKRRYIVSRVTQGVSQPTFVSGVELVYWNGMPIERAVWNNAQRFAGSNREARHARGVQTLTLRALQVAPPPDEEWVVVGYRTTDGHLKDIHFHWQVNPPLPSAMSAAAEGGDELATAAVLGLDLEQDIVRRMRIALFAPQVVKAREKAEDKTARGAAFGALESKLPSVFGAKEITTTSGKFGYLRIWTFGHPRTDEFVQEFVRLIGSLPQNGLVIDVRGNGGGVIMNGEYILQTLTPRRIEPEPVQFVNTPLNLQICRFNGPTSRFTNLSAWVDSMEQALRTGSVFSAGFPISSPDKANEIGQKYFGPVVLITDALCYSTTDIFAAGFQDHEIGPVLGTDGNTGAGGANVWEHRFFVSHLLPGGGVYEPLPNGAGMRVSMRRTLRVGRRAGAPLEDLGVVPDQRHHLTKNDLVNDNADLLNRAGELLAAQKPVRALRVKVQSTSAAQATLLVETQAITRLDVYLGDRPNQSVDVRTSPTTLVVPRPAAQTMVEIRGFDGGKLVARYRITV